MRTNPSDGGGPIVVYDADPAWPSTFGQEKKRVHAALGSIVTKIEHVGSTAVPGLAAKPIIDLLVGVRSLAEAKSSCVEPLRGLGYTYIAEYESWLPGDFRKGIPGPWTHYAHVLEPSSPHWDEYIQLRDYLRRHPEIASAYANLKKALALGFDDDIAGYRNAKRPFLQAIMGRAQAERA